MNEEQFKKMRSKIINVLRFALQNEYSDFYRKKYQNLGFDPLSIKTYKEFRRLPLLTREEIINTPLAKRLFVDPKNIYYTVTSGTTKSNKPLITPHLNHKRYSDLGSFSKETVAQYGLQRCLVLLPPTSPLFQKITLTASQYLNIFAGDMTKLKITAMVAKEIGVDFIITTPTTLCLFIRELKKIKFNPGQIKRISLGGESVSEIKNKYFREYFRNATFEYKYGAAEIDSQRGIFCEYLTGNNPSVFHSNEKFLFEVWKDDQANVIGDGDLIHTDLDQPAAFPLIRYQTGDPVELGKKDCPCGKKDYLQINHSSGRRAARFFGTTVYMEIIEDILKPFGNLTGDKFDALLSEEIIENEIRAKITIRMPKRLLPEADNIRASVLPVIKERLHLGSGTNLSKAIEAGIFTEPEVVFDLKDDAKSINNFIYIK